MVILNKPKCHNYDNCGHEALALANNMWLCGDCIIKIQEKVRKIKEKLLLEE
jgi:hypothetical protein